MDRQPPEIRLKGISLSPGVAVGRGCFLKMPGDHAPSPRPHTLDGGVELRRLTEALTWLSERCARLAADARSRIGEAQAEIFDAHKMMVEDPALVRRLRARLDEGALGAEAAVSEAMGAYEAQLLASPLPHFRERAEDIATLRTQLLGRLMAKAPVRRCVAVSQCALGVCPGGAPHALVADELTPSLVLETDPLTVAFIVNRGGPTSHGALLAQGLGLPAVGGIEAPGARIALTDVVVVDGDAGEVILNPPPEALAAYRRQAAAAGVRALPPVPGMRILANIDLAVGARAARQAQAEGIGLYRTELEAMSQGRLLSEEEQRAHYQGVLDTMEGWPVYIRLLDVGADKVGSWTKLPPAPNPALGQRGARLLLAEPRFLEPQARALARVAQGREVNVIYPMIEDRAQFLQLKEAFEGCVEDLPPSRLRHGVMFEIPSACTYPEPLLEIVDFGCVGTNDLIQYLFAVDREAMDHRPYFRHPALWHLLEQLSRSAQRAGVPLTVCGALASEAELIPRLMEIGIGGISVAPARIAPLRASLRR